MGNADESPSPEGVVSGGEPEDGAVNDPDAADPGGGETSLLKRALPVSLSVLRNLSIRQALTAFFLVVLAASVPFGGLRAASVPPATQVTADEPFDAAPFTVTVTGVRYGQDIGASSVPAADGRYLVVLADVSTTEQTSIPQATLKDVVRIKGVSGLVRNSYDTRSVENSLDAPPSNILLVDDAQPMGDVPPDLTYKLALFFLQQPGQPAPTSLEVVLFSQTNRASSIDQSLGWFDPVQAGVLTLPAKAFTEAGATPSTPDPTATATAAPSTAAPTTTAPTTTAPTSPSPSTTVPAPSTTTAAQ